MGYKFLIADDHSIVRTGIKTLLNDYFSPEVVDAAGTDNEVVKLIRTRSYDLVILDIQMPGVDFTNLIYLISTTTPETKIVVFSMYGEEIYGKRCLQLGAKGFINKSTTDHEIIQALQKVLNGGIYASPTLQEMLVSTPAQERSSNPFDRLTPRELEIAILINKGMKLPAISTTLNIQYSTANTFKRRVFEKLEVDNPVSLSNLMKAYNIES